jgi:hypothetical protein
LRGGASRKEAVAGKRQAEKQSQSRDIDQSAQAETRSPNVPRRIES